MRSNRLGCLTGTGIFTALFTALVIVGFVYAGGGRMFSPGALNAIHGDIVGGITAHADIEGACSACHVAPWESQTMDDRCLFCHADITAQKSDSTTSHGRMYAIDPTATCRECHTEHKGPAALLTEMDGWRYPHETSGFSLAAHQFKSEKDPFKCADCHGNDVTTFDVGTCATCHSQIDQAFTTDHIAAYGESCVGCHDGVDRFDKNFSHAGFSFKLVGKHEQVACKDCHVNARALADFAAAPQDCVSCHSKDDPHGGALGPDCASCHTADGWKPAHFDHGTTAFPLTDSHVNVDCKQCHINNVFKGTPKDCFACHKQDDPHGGELGQDCAKCHKTTKWNDAFFDHSKSAFPLLGKHTSVLCMNCHKNNVFAGTPKDCAACHVDVHLGQMGKECSRCHNTNDWKDVIFDHSKTAFPLSGGHTKVACASCHINGKFKGTPKTCFACHAAKDKHNGQFGKDCASCHNTSGWKNVTFDHSTTAFPLTGAHTTALCTACHVNGVYKGTPKDCFSCHASKDKHMGQFGTNCGSCHNTSSWKGATFNHANTAFPLVGTHATVVCASCHVNNVYKGTPKNCYACHAAKDKHNGQFGTDCSACHKPTKWADVNFNHNNTRFPLTGLHTTVLCTACHLNGVYKGTPTTCYACHAAKDKHNGQFGTDCAACHVTSGWANVTFDHNNTAFPLIGHHTQLACSKCHGNGVYKGTPTQCIACHADKDKHNGANGTDCSICHTPRDWGAVKNP